MDALKDSVSLRGYGQRDPLQEYKKEGFRLFELLMSRIHEETTLALLTIEIPDQSSIPSPTEEEYDESNLEFKHPDATSISHVEDEKTGPEETSKSDSLIYHGSRQQSDSENRNPPPPMKRELDKIGRNDPCPCGSGKKYKKCHGSPGISQEGI